jgi:signal transduction histidine kinase
MYNIIFRPLRKMIAATKQIASGNYKVELEETSHPQSELGMLQRSFNNMARELDGIEMFRNDFINNFSHEFKTPMVSIRGYVQQLQVGGLSDEEQREYINIIAAESDRLTNMASNILLLSKLENQQIVTEKTEFYLDEQIRGCILVLEKQWVEKNIELDIDLDPIKYTFNEDILSHLWINLFGNAIKFTPNDGKISCTLRRKGDFAVAVISDTGIGMDADTQKHIFEKFYQGDSSHSSQGNGIGLTIVSRILTLCAGDITIDSRPGLGSTFTVKLPLKNN